MNEVMRKSEHGTIPFSAGRGDEFHQDILFEKLVDDLTRGEVGHQIPVIFAGARLRHPPHHSPKQDLVAWRSGRFRRALRSSENQPGDQGRKFKKISE